MFFRILHRVQFSLRIIIYVVFYRYRDTRNFIEITLRHGWCSVNLLHIFRTPLLKNTSGGLLLMLKWVIASFEFLKENLYLALFISIACMTNIAGSIFEGSSVSGSKPWDSLVFFWKKFKRSCSYSGSILEN